MGGTIKYPRALALTAAGELCTRLTPSCEPGFLKCCGSLRRGRPEVGDIEIVYVPKMGLEPDGLFDTRTYSLAQRELEKMLKEGVIEKRPNKAGHFTWGDLNQLAIHRATGIPVDFFATSLTRWWMTVVIRTGPKGLNIALATGARARGLKLHAYGNYSRGGDEVVCRTEKEVFELAGIPYCPPEARDKFRSE